MHSQNAVSALLLEISDAAENAIRESVSLSTRELAALVLVCNRRACTVTWLHARLGLTQSGAVRLLDRLERLGLVDRQRSAGQREVALSITQRGEKTVARGTSARGQAIDAALVGLTPTDRDTFMALAARALANNPSSRDEGDEACRLCDWQACTPDCPMDRAVAAGQGATASRG